MWLRLPVVPRIFPHQMSNGTQGEALLLRRPTCLMHTELEKSPQGPCIKLCLCPLHEQIPKVIEPLLRGLMHTPLV